MNYNNLVLIGTIILGFDGMKSNQPCLLINCPDRIFVFIKEQEKIIRKFILRDKIVDVLATPKVLVGIDYQKLEIEMKMHQKLLDEIINDSVRLRINIDLKEYSLIKNPNVAFETIFTIKNENPGLKCENIKLIIRSYNENDTFVKGIN